MWRIGILLVACAAMAQAPSFQPVGTMSQLMISIIYPTSDAIFYIDRAPLTTETQWNTLRGQALMLAESGNLLMIGGRARDQADWIKFSNMMLEAGRTAYKAALTKDLDGIRGVNDQLYSSCVGCHSEYRPNYGRRPQAGQQQK